MSALSPEQQSIYDAAQTLYEAGVVQHAEAPRWDQLSPGQQKKWIARARQAEAAGA